MRRSEPPAKAASKRVSAPSTRSWAGALVLLYSAAHPANASSAGGTTSRSNSSRHFPQSSRNPPGTDQTIAAGIQRAGAGAGQPLRVLVAEKAPAERRLAANSRSGISPTDYPAIRSTRYSSVIEIPAVLRLSSRDPVVARRRAKIFVGQLSREVTMVKDRPRFEILPIDPRTAAVSLM
jgi:hypothetical protein